MKSTLKILIPMAVAIGLASSASADLLYTFTTGVAPVNTGTTPSGGESWDNGTLGWNSTYQAAQVLTTAGGWTATDGAGKAGKLGFNWPSQSVMWAFDDWAAGSGRVSGDIKVSATDSYNFYTFHTEGGNWVNIQLTGNSGGTAGWTGPLTVGNYTVDPVAGNLEQSFHFDYSFAQLGWGETPGTSTDNYYQLYFGPQTANADQTIQILVDNIHIVPEPTTFALAGLGAAALLIFRRRR